MFKIIASASLFLVLIFINGCWFMRLPSDKPEEFTATSEMLKSLQGATSEHVMQLLGSPEWTAFEDDKKYFIYEWRSNEVSMLWFAYVPTPLIGSDEDAELHCILLEFLGDDILNSYKVDTAGQTYRGYSNCPDVFGMRALASRVVDSSLLICPESRSTEMTKLAEEGNANAMYKVYLSMYEAYIEPVAAWTWLCRAADQGHENAQIEVAYWHRESNWALANSDRIAWLRKAHVHSDDRVAYLWYTLAANGNEKRLGIRDDLFTETLSGNGIKEAQGMVNNWKPGQCERELSLGIGNE